MERSIEAQQRLAERYTFSFRLGLLTFPINLLALFTEDPEAVMLGILFLVGFTLYGTRQLCLIARSQRLSLRKAHRWAFNEDREHGYWHKIIQKPLDLVKLISFFVILTITTSVLCHWIQHVLANP